MCINLWAPNFYIYGFHSKTFIVYLVFFCNFLLSNGKTWGAFTSLVDESPVSRSARVLPSFKTQIRAKKLAGFVVNPLLVIRDGAGQEFSLLHCTLNGGKYLKSMEKLKTYTIFSKGIVSRALSNHQGSVAAPVSQVKMLDVSKNSQSEPTIFISPAKVNLFLRVLRKRKDGFHDLASLFHTINLADSITLEPVELEESAKNLAPENGDVFSVESPSKIPIKIPLDNTNLILRALGLFRLRTSISQRFRIRLVKEIPSLAGLGGGSSNAATALFAANEFCGRPATSDQLGEWSAELGSDVPFFMSNGVAYCSGRGEIVQLFLGGASKLPSQTIYIFKPHDGLSTATVFKLLDLSYTSKYSPLNLLEAFLGEESMITKDFKEQDNNTNIRFSTPILSRKKSTNLVDNLSEKINPLNAFVNDLEKPAFSSLSLLKEIKEQLLQKCGFSAVMMTGSGTSILALGEPFNSAELEAVLEHFPGLSAFRCQFISRSLPSWYTLSTKHSVVRK